MWSLRWLAIGITMLAASGCATYHTSALIWPGVAEHKGKGMDHVYEVTAAYRDQAGAVLICVRGTPAGPIGRERANFPCSCRHLRA